MEGLTFTCPICGADVPRRAKACPECGACEKSGWSENRHYDGWDLPGEGYGGDSSYGPRRLGGPSRQTLVQRLWFVIAIIIVIAMAWMTLRGLW